MKKLDKKAFDFVDERTGEVWDRFRKYFVNDTKVFENKLNRDYERTGKFPVHVLKMVGSIPRENYDCAVCVLRGAIPYGVIFEAYGWKVRYLICGRKNEIPVAGGKDLRFNRSVDKGLRKIKGKKILIIENNSPSGRTPIRVAEELKRIYGARKPDLFLDYFSLNRKIMPWLKDPFWKSEKKLGKFDRVFEASGLRVGTRERGELLREFLENCE